MVTTQPSRAFAEKGPEISGVRGGEIQSLAKKEGLADLWGQRSDQLETIRADSNSKNNQWVATKSSGEKK